MSDDELVYLTSGFDLNTLTVPRIRSILVSHDVSYPSSAKKAQLIEILQNEILPKSKKLLAARERTKRTSKGIEDVPSSQEGTVDGDAEAELMPPPPVPKTPRRRTKKSHIGPEAGEDDVAPPPSTSRKSKTPGRRTTTKGTKASDTETDTNTENAVASPRKSRKSQVAATPARTSHVKIEEPELELKREPLATDSPFSDDNPFQSGSPDGGSRRSSSIGKRKSLNPSSSRDTEKRKSSSRRRETTSPTPIHDEKATAPSRSTYEYPVSRLQGSEDLDITEEFTPEAKLELVRERAAEGYSGKDLLPPRPKKRKPASKASKAAPWVVISILVSSFGLWWRQEKLEIGYCGVGKPNWSLADTNVPQWANVLEPHCESCPQHGYCYPNLETRCEADYVLKSHPYSFYGLVPVPPTCEPDGEKARKVKAVADRAIEELRERRAQYECGELADHEKPEIAENELKEELKSKRSKKMSDEEFDELWTAAIGDVVAREEVVSEGDSFSLSPDAELHPSSPDEKLEGSAAHPSPDSDTSAQQKDALKASGETEEGWISIGQLRDDVLREVLRATDRERVWKHVRGVVEGNANVRAGTRESASGEWVRVWEWIGPTGRRFVRGGQIRKDSGLLEGSEADAVAGESMATDGAADRNWNEGRPIY
ncbi:putative sister chromatid separation protein [Phaeomoniella chlamydospora]|uniref:Putative sister chromatid separation protein n=1 Tax=Phaeomoniella chlamydospora TaxID=158046 RepID=A0A0G2ET85_PHACM|nr:putative sister chromatid separation protein [Phaeomoniella chlamydospora]